MTSLHARLCAVLCTIVSKSSYKNFLETKTSFLPSTFVCLQWVLTGYEKWHSCPLLASLGGFWDSYNLYTRTIALLANLHTCTYIYSWAYTPTKVLVHTYAHTHNHACIYTHLNREIYRTLYLENGWYTYSHVHVYAHVFRDPEPLTVCAKTYRIRLALLLLLAI